MLRTCKTDLAAVARRCSLPARWGPPVLPLAGGHVQAVAGPVQDGLDLLLVRALVAVVGGGSVGVCGGSGSCLLSVGLHDAAEVGGLVGDMLQVGLQELGQHSQGPFARELFQGIQGALIQI